jgi:uncharacterized protein YrrD
MLISVDTLKDYKLNCIDGEIGSVKDFFFDDKFWTIRYLVVTTGSWLNRKQVLISPYFLKNISHGTELIHVNLTKREVENSPSADTDKPVSRQFEEDYYKYYGAPVYWGGPYMWGTSAAIPRNRDEWKTSGSMGSRPTESRSMESGSMGSGSTESRSIEHNWDPHLRSTKDVSGHNIQATDEKIGDVDDFIIDDENWTIRYFIVDTGNWLPGKKVLISPQWIDRISWEDSKVFVNVTSDSIKNAPEYDETLSLTRDYETSLYNYYGRKGYWTEEAVHGDYSRWVNR